MLFYDSIQVMLDTHGQSKGSGFVAFSSLDEANRAVSKATMLRNCYPVLFYDLDVIALFKMYI